MSKLTIAVGIPTSFAGDSLMHTVNSIRKNKAVLQSF